jgi:DNA-directed RNA polymerase subunit RPC12/RpoP
MPNWVLHCANCRKQFVHSEIDGQSSIHLAQKPDFSLGGDEWKCPHCQHKAIYQRYQLTYRASPVSVKMSADK